MKTNEFLRLAKEAGCRFVSHGKEHDLWVSKDGIPFRVPRHGNKEIGRGLLFNLKKKAGLK
ncbi:MAG: type II toxin-antitoxin system HicA family toxin [Mediterranea sp.]|nr:type II toxin-antitoxin system HicA family toxin [Mediterranea sp.]